MIDQNKFKQLKTNIRQVVKDIMITQKIQTNTGFDTFSGTNQDSINKIKQEIMELKEYQEQHPEFRVRITQLFQSKQIFKITMIGRHNSFFQNKKIYAYIFFPDHYPKMSPVIYFQNVLVDNKQQTYQHVNVFSKGQLSQQIIKSNYSQTNNFKNILVMTEDTLYSPNPLSPANGKLCTLYCKEDKTEYNNVIKRQSFYLQQDDKQQ